MYCACHARCIFADPLEMCHACHRLWKCYKTLPFCSLLTRCTTPCACHAKRHLNVQRCSEHVIFLKINILTSKCASRHNGVHFFGISTFKSGPRLRCFVHFDYDTCFVPQRRAFFSTSQLQKALQSSGVLYILTFAFFPFHLSKVLRLSRKGDVSSCMSE